MSLFSQTSTDLL